MNFSISLFQQQSYLDAWETYTELLRNRSSAGGWDYIILTASNESQADSYRRQIEHRLSLIHICIFFILSMTEPPLEVCIAIRYCNYSVPS